MPGTLQVGYVKDAGGATTPGFWWYHMVTESLMNLLTAAGISPSASDMTQITQAVIALAKANSVTGNLKPVRAIDTTGSITYSGVQTLDTVVLVDGDRILKSLPGGSTTNGIWVVNAGGAWTRSVDMAAGVTIQEGTIIAVSEGSAANINSVWTLNKVTGESATVGTTIISFANITASTQAMFASYLSIANAATTYLTQSSAASTYATQASLSAYYSASASDGRYLKITDAQANYVQNSALTTTLASYVTNTSLTSTLGSYVTNASLASTLSSYDTISARNTALSSYVTNSSLTTTLGSYYTAATISGNYLTIANAASTYVSNTSLASTLSSYVTSSSLTTTLGSYVTNSSLTSTLGSYVTNSSLTSTLGSYVLTSVLSGYVTNTSLTSTLSSYDTISARNTALASYATSAYVTGNPQMNSLGVGTAADGTAGNIRATGTITGSYSDDNLKERDGALSGPQALDMVRELDVFFYYPNEYAQSLGVPKVRELGMSAQQHIKVGLKEVVAEAGLQHAPERREEGPLLTLRYERDVPVLMAAVKELEKQLKSRDEDFIKLQTEVERLIASSRRAPGNLGR
jgi:hypothetical protein